MNTPESTVGIRAGKEEPSYADFLEKLLKCNPHTTEDWLEQGELSRLAFAAAYKLVHTNRAAAVGLLAQVQKELQTTVQYAKVMEKPEAIIYATVDQNYIFPALGSPVCNQSIQQARAAISHEDEDIPALKIG